jgi:LacI family transcriptional regulator
MATIRDVAQHAGVSLSTVSHVVNGTRWVSDELRQRVERAMHELGFAPNTVAQSLRRNRTNTLGLVVYDIANPAFSLIASGVEAAAAERGYTIMLRQTGEDEAREATSLHLLRTRRVDGVLLQPIGTPHAALVDLVQTGPPVALLERDVPDLGVPVVMLDNHDAVYQATHHLLSLGHRRIALITGRRQSEARPSRLSGYVRALAEAGVTPDSALMVTAPPNARGGAEATAALLRIEPRPTAVVAANNLVSVGALAAVREAGLAIPRDMALVGFDDFAWADTFQPRLTTISRPMDDLGRRAAATLIDRIAGKQPAERRTLMTGTLIVRESCGATIRRRSPTATESRANRLGA